MLIIIFYLIFVCNAKALNLCFSTDIIRKTWPFSQKYQVLIQFECISNAMCFSQHNVGTWVIRIFFLGDISYAMENMPCNNIQEFPSFFTKSRFLTNSTIIEHDKFLLQTSLSLENAIKFVCFTTFILLRHVW